MGVTLNQRGTLGQFLKENLVHIGVIYARAYEKQPFIMENPSPFEKTHPR